MDLTRRRLLHLSAASATMLATGGDLAWAGPAPADEVRENALRYFGQLGFAPLPPLDMITGATFNDGLRYDDTRPDPPTAPSLVVQTAARIDDIAEKDQPGVLAAFNIFAVSQPDPSKPETLLASILDFLTSERKLDLDRMLFVSTERFRPLVARIDGVDAERVFERDLDEAMQAGDGSGFFAPKGHPWAPSGATVGIYYQLPGADAGAELSYPPAGFIEIAEVGIETFGGGQPQVGGFGLERVAMAEGEEIPDFEETKLNLLRIIEDEARRTGKDLPPGYTKFASL